MQNPLLGIKGLPPFSAIKPEHVEPAIEKLLADNRATVMALLKDKQNYSWETLVEPLEAMEDTLSRAWSPVGHMNSVVNTEVLRNAYNACLPKLSEYSTELGQNQALFDAYRQIAESDEYQAMDTAQKKTIDNALRDFRLSGVELPTAERERYKAIMQELSTLSAKYGDNVLDATNAWQKHITDETELKGLPKTAMSLAQQTARQKDLDGWLFTLDFPSYYPVITYADNRALREEMYRAYVTRASDQGPHDKQLNNDKIMAQILALRHEAAQLLGFKNYAERSIATKMADSTTQVLPHRSWTS